MKRAAILALTILTTSRASVPTYAEIDEDKVTRWHIHNFSGGNVEVYFTQAPCSSGRMFLTSNMTAESSNCWWSLLLTARASNKTVGVVYNRAFAGAEAPVAINSAVEVDLFGRPHAELMPRGLMSGPGGATDFAYSVRAAGGLRIVALPSSAASGRISRIVPAGAGRGPVSLGRFDLDIVVTEHGAADLRGRSYDERAQALAAIAHPTFHEGLERGWREVSIHL